MKQPCKQCPYRKDSAPGYLGESSNDPETFLEQLESHSLHPCHLTVDWEDKDGGYEKAEVCVGALQFMNNSLKRSKYPMAKDMQDKAGKNSEIFNWRSDFIKHHS